MIIAPTTLIKFCFSLLTGMTDDEILRAEMVSQLCMNDRTHSALLDLVSFSFIKTLNNNYVQSFRAVFFSLRFSLRFLRIPTQRVALYQVVVVLNRCSLLWRTLKHRCLSLEAPCSRACTHLKVGDFWLSCM